uniref:dual-specificity kinase n=3 Tax=Hirondellea gigas TaxID=1518452 RepID=A0A6A7FSI1_9CRUS
MRRGNCGRLGTGGGGGVGMCGRPVSWSTSSWRVPHLPTTCAATDTTNTKFAAHSTSLIESCEEETSVTENCYSANNESKDKNNATNRLKAKTSLDETKLRTKGDLLESENFLRSDAMMRTQKGALDRGGFSGFGHKVVLARSSSYQALHSALARLYRLDDFTTERLGQGFFSEVYKVRHRVTGDVMVLKMNKLLSNRHNMLREIELMNRLHHNNILTYYGVCIHEGQVHSLTEYINGGSLDAMLQDRAVEMSWVERVALAADTARGMAYLHAQGVFHRDLTSKNVLIKEKMTTGGRKKREAVVADFGLAAPIPKDKNVRMRQVGSPYWMAPEVIRGEWYDHRADVFSFGIILCEMIARCEADPDVLPRTNNFGVHYLAFSRMCLNDCPPYFLQMAFQCCQIDPERRPSFEILTKNFESLINRLVGHRATSAHRKQKVCHRRSLSDDGLMLGRTSSNDDSSSGSSGSSHGSAALPSTTASEVGRTPQEVVERMGAADPYFTPSTATVNPFTRVKLPAPSRLTVQDGARFCHSLPDLPPGKVLASTQHNSFKGDLSTNHHGSQSSLFPSLDNHRCPGTVKPENGSGGAGAAAHVVHLGGAVKRRGSGESGFFSVGDMDRTGTPELWLSYSELSSASMAGEDEERSWVTDSSEDLCGQEEPFTQETDIKAIVEFFESGYGSLRPGPLMGPRSSRLSPRSPASPPHCHMWSNSHRPSVSKAGLRQFCTRKDTFRVKDRPKLYITEGTVRAKRDIFEAK